MDKEKTTRQRLAEWSKTPEGRESYEKVASEMRKQISEDEELENEISKSIENLEGCSTKIDGNPEYHLISDEDLREFARHFHELGCHRTAEKYDEIEYNRQRAEESEKPMNQDELEKAVVDYFEGYWPGMETAEQCNTDLHFTPPAIMRLASHFAQWGAEHLADARKTSPKDLEEAANEFANQDCVTFISRKNGFIAGAEWAREQMMKEAVEISYKGGTARINGEEKPFDGGKVRVIIVKEDEK